MHSVIRSQTAKTTPKDGDSNFPYLEKLSKDLYYVTTSTAAPRMHYRDGVENSFELA